MWLVPACGASMWYSMWYRMRAAGAECGTDGFSVVQRMHVAAWGVAAWGVGGQCCCGGLWVQGLHCTLCKSASGCLLHRWRRHLSCDK
jgi:hypothetical protein